MPSALGVDATNGNGGLGLAIAALSLCGCGGLVSPGSRGPSVSGNWVAEPAIGALGVALDVKRDGSYVITNLTLTSQTMANATVETGTLTVSGGTITFTPKEWSCRGPRPVWSAPFSFQDGDLLVTQPTYVLKLQPTDATATAVLDWSSGARVTRATSRPKRWRPSPTELLAPWKCCDTHEPSVRLAVSSDSFAGCEADRALFGQAVAFASGDGRAPGTRISDRGGSFAPTSRR